MFCVERLFYSFPLGPLKILLINKINVRNAVVLKSCVFQHFIYFILLSLHRIIDVQLRLISLHSLIDERLSVQG